MLANPHKAVILIVFAMILGGYTLMAFNYPLAYIWATYEDLVGEWSQTYFFFAAAILSVIVAQQKSRYRWFFALLAIACSYVVLEEISWGQRIFGFETPEFLKARNLQGEANLHNLFTGPHKTLLKDLISIAVSVSIVGFGLLYPLLLSRKWKIALWADKLGVAAPPLVLAPFFTVAAFFELKPLSFNEAEVAELLIAVALAMFALHQLLVSRLGLVTPNTKWNRNDSLILGRWLIILLSSIVVAAALTTAGFYSVPANKARVDNRIENGIEKFAGRYERYDRCDVANKLYEMLLRKEPDRVYILRKQAACYAELGESGKFEETVSKAIDIDLQKYNGEPWRASVNQSLVRSYRLAGDAERADAHLAEALDIGISRIMSKPDSASAAYSYGRTLRLAGRDEEALEQFTRAYEMKPTSSRYRSAYFAARARLN
ncbi:MAG: tetratricopeptide repeat protein [Gammaproteobacteria bacterium]|nr:tetratricopeptide repeat protein [Gammaproteobacteria bacterium]